MTDSKEELQFEPLSLILLGLGFAVYCWGFVFPPNPIYHLYVIGSILLGFLSYKTIRNQFVEIKRGSGALEMNIDFPHIHKWEVATGTIFNLNRFRLEIQIACTCGAYKYIKAFEVKE